MSNYFQKKYLLKFCLNRQIIYWAFDLAPPLVRDVCINLRTLAALMSQKFLCVPQIHPLFQRMCGKRVNEGYVQLRPCRARVLPVSESKGLRANARCGGRRPAVGGYVRLSWYILWPLLVLINDLFNLQLAFF